MLNTNETENHKHLAQLVDKVKSYQQQETQPSKQVRPMHLINETEIVARLYNNKVYGTTYGKALYRNAIYNGTIETKSPNAKYLVDFYDYNGWESRAKTDGQMDVLGAVDKEADTLYSWIYRYDVETKSKTLVDGFASINCDTNEMVVLICDNEMHITEQWNLDAKQCKHVKNGPQMFATNSDLGTW